MVKWTVTGRTMFSFTIRIYFVFNQFKIENHPDVKCPYDFLTVFAGRNHGPLCGRRLPKNITSTSNSMTIRFVTDDSTHLKGFFAKYYSEGELKAMLCFIILNSEETLMHPVTFQ